MKKDVWAAGDLYEPYVGRWSRVVAHEFLPWLGVPRARRWLDVGCGTGALTQCIQRECAPAGVHGVDPSPGFIEYAKAHAKDASFEVGDAQSLPVANATFDAAVAGLVLNFVPKPDRAAAEMRRAVKPGGVVAAYVWDYAGKMELMRYFWDAAVELNSEARALDEGVRFPLCHPDPFAALFREAGLTKVEVRAIDAPTPGYCMSLDETERAALRERIRAKLPFRPDGSINLIARAWAVKGKVPD